MGVLGIIFLLVALAQFLVTDPTGQTVLAVINWIFGTFFGEIRKHSAVSQTSTAVASYRPICPIISKGSSSSVRNTAGAERMAASRTGQANRLSQRS